MAPRSPLAEAPRRPRPLEIVAALCAGALLTFMLLSNGMMAAQTTPIFASLTAHGVGSVVAALLMVLLLLRARPASAATPRRGRAPLWAYLGGISGALTVIVSTVVVNSPLALTGTMALGLVGQVVLALTFDCVGALGMERRLPRRNDLMALAAITAGTLLIIFARGAVQ